EANHFFPGTDLTMIERIAQAVLPRWPHLTDAEVAHLLRKTYRNDQKSAALWISTLPAYIGSMQDARTRLSKISLKTITACMDCGGSGRVLRPEIDPFDDKWARKYWRVE